MPGEPRHVVVLPPTLFVGTAGQFSAIVLEAIIAARMPLTAVLVCAPSQSLFPLGGLSLIPGTEGTPGPTGEPSLLPMIGPPARPSLAELARNHCIPLLSFGSLREPSTVKAIAPLVGQLIVTACCPQILPDELLHLPRLGGVNLHPSMLPRLRGPNPLFRSFWLGQTETGITVHRLERRIDAGGIYAQENLAIPDGCSGLELEAACAARGGSILVDTIRSLAAGSDRPLPQDESRASYYSWPKRADFRVQPNWSAERAFRFSRGVASWGAPYLILDGIEREIRDAIGWRRDEALAAEAEHDGDIWRVRCGTGVISVRLD